MFLHNLSPKFLFIRLFHCSKALGKRILPEKAKNFYREYRKEYHLVDRSEVVLYAGDSSFPGYTPRCSLDTCFAQGYPRVKISLIATTLNEAASVRDWLQSLLKQSRWPDEVIITDGGSKDDTVQIINEITHSFPIPIKVIEAPGANIARGRNIAIQHADFPIIACTDLGCTLDPEWLKNLIAPFEHDSRIELSAGYYQVIPRKTLDRLCSHFFGIDLRSVKPEEFLPSSRSLAMKKSFWTKVGGYPEWLTDAGEDTLFDYAVKSQKARWAFVPQARVYWKAPHSLNKLIKTYFRYSRGDGEVGSLASHYWYKTVEVIWTNLVRVVILAIFLVLALILQGWIILPVAGVALFALYRFWRENQRISSQLGIGFYPYTLVAEILGTVQMIGFYAGVKNRPKVLHRQTEFYANQLQHILEAHPQRAGIIVYPPTHDWTFMFQRPHQMARAFARKGYLFFYCTANERTDAVWGIQELEPNLYLCHVPLESFRIIKQPFAYIGSAWNRVALTHFDYPRLIYDHYDDLTVSGANLDDHLELVRQADILLVTSRKLYEKITTRHLDALLLPNGVDYDYILRSKPGSSDTPPLDWLPISAKQRPIIGYSGALAEWFDYDLLAHLAIQCPDFEFVLIGVDYDGSLPRSSILDLPNVHWLGMKAYDQLFPYIWRFDVGFIPFIINDITLSTSPIKMFEYMACEKPVVATALPECQLYPGIFVAESGEDFLNKINQALHARYNADYLALIRRIAQENTWTKRVDTVITQINRL